MEYYGVDAFTSEPYRGNPAAVVLLDGAREPDWMQRVAAELGQPSTAFVHAGEDGRRRLRWFTPTTELPLCGHATVATAHVLYETAVSRSEELTFDTAAGPIPVRHDDGLIWLDLASVEVGPAPPQDDVLHALGAPPDAVAWFGRNDNEYVVVLDDPALVARLRPDFAAVCALPAARVIVTAAGGAAADVTSRVFTPRLGVDEDAVTGSAHAVLGPLWAARLGARRLRAVQASARGGVLAVRVDGDRTHVGGAAVTVASGRLHHLG